jgi:hypothetical protein
MAAIQPGTGGTFKSTTAEGRLMEAICFLQLREADSIENPNGRNAIQGDFSIQNLVFSGSYNFAAEQAISSTGSLSIVASPYLQNTIIAPGGNNPTFKSLSLEGYVLEVLMHFQALERVAANNPQGQNFITGTYNSDIGIYTGSFSLPIAMSLDGAGKPSFEAVEYLLT